MLVRDRLESKPNATDASAAGEKKPQTGLSYCFSETHISPSQAELCSRHIRHSETPDRCIHAVERSSCKAGFDEKA
jgi:hypothetical protein